MALLVWDSRSWDADALICFFFRAVRERERRTHRQCIHRHKFLALFLCVCYICWSRPRKKIGQNMFFLSSKKKQVLLLLLVLRVGRSLRIEDAGVAITAFQVNMCRRGQRKKAERRRRRRGKQMYKYSTFPLCVHSSSEVGEKGKRFPSLS